MAMAARAVRAGSAARQGQGTAMSERGVDLAALLAGLAGDAVATQRHLDRSHRQALASLPGLAPAAAAANPEPWVGALAPARMRLDRVGIEVSIRVRAQERAGGTLGLDILAMPVHNFLWRRYALTEDHVDRVAVEVQATPCTGPARLHDDAEFDDA